MPIKKISLESAVSTVPEEEPWKLSKIVRNEKEWHALQKAKEVLTHDLRNSPTIKQLAKSVNLSESKLKAGFKETFGAPVATYCRDFKLDKAREMIIAGKHSIGYIASEVGFANAGHFSQCFKKKFGLLPKDFRKQHFMAPHQAKTSKVKIVQSS